MWASLASFLSLFAFLVSIVLIVAVIMQRKEATSTLAWILLIVFLPLIGAVIYLWLGVARVEKRVELRKKRNRIIEKEIESVERALKEYKILPEHEERHPVHTALIAMSRTMKTHDVAGGNECTFLPSSDESIEALFSLIREAHDSIHCEFYILAADETGRRFRELLIEMAQRGVSVRLLIDGIGSWNLRNSFLKPLRTTGIQVARYMPITPFGRPWHWNLRNHRKIAVIDGTTAFIGSKNVEDTNRLFRKQHYHFCEYGLINRGPIVQELQEIFAQDWYVATRENLFSDRHFPLPVRAGSAIGQVVTSGPDKEERTLHEMLCTAIHTAQKRIRITTPYFVPDPALMTALRSAALRGVSVRILTGKHSPNLQETIARIAGQSYYAELLRAGAEIWEYQPGFMHAKSITIDGCFASVGTANMDVRSFRLNFELNINLYTEEIVTQIEEAFDSSMKQAISVTLESLAKQSIDKRFLQNALRTLSPIL